MAGLLVAAAGGLLAGWRLFWFLTDDAYIAFRYIANRHLGYGYTWNPPPFRPVEGYTSFLWVTLLDAIWSLSGVAPPESANWLALVFSGASLLMAALCVQRMRLTPALDSARRAFVALVLLGALTNRTFLAWSSSGLETAMFNFLFVAWAMACVWGGTDARAGHWFLRAVTAALLGLTRPDGLLPAAATFGWVAGSSVVAWRRGAAPTARLLAAAPLLAVPAHVVWRRQTYGLWLPNTYYAKYVAPWPESGVRYFLSYLLEYALWVWLAVLAVVWWRAYRSCRRHATGPGRDALRPAARPRLLAGALADHAGILIAGATLVLHAAYYTLMIGGDHFEYRVYSHLVVPLLVSFLWLLGRLGTGSRGAVALFAGFILLSLPVPWTHWAQSRHLEARQVMLKVAVADSFPRPLRWYARWFDELQSWLIDHLVCIRHQEHKIFHRHLHDIFPPRAAGLRLSREGFPVLASTNVGVAAWKLPHVSIIDLLGLNDHVIARSTRAAVGERYMLHERRPPRGYVASFRPNVAIRPEGGVEIRARAAPLTSDEIVLIERRWWGRVGD